MATVAGVAGVQRFHLKESVTYWSLTMGSWIIPRLPKRVSHFVATVAGQIAFLLPLGSRQGSMQNIRRVLGPEASVAEVKRASRSAFVCAALNFVDLFRLPLMTTEQIRTEIALTNSELLYEALRRNKGVILFGPHVGNADWVAQVLSVHNFKVVAPAERTESARILDLMTRLRCSQGLKFVPLGNSALRQVYMALKRGEIVTLAADRDVSGTGRLVEFFGAPASLPSGPVALARRTGAVVVAAHAVRGYGGPSLGFIDEIVDFEWTDDEELDIRLGMRRIAEILESRIGEHPEQWVVFQPVWQSDKNGHASD